MTNISEAISVLVTPLADHYILNGIVYQCPDIQSVVNSRLVSKTLEYGGSLMYPLG